MNLNLLMRLGFHLNTCTVYGMTFAQFVPYVAPH